MIELVEKLINDGTMKKLVDGGLISPNVIMFRNIFNEYNKELALKKTKLNAIESVCFKFKISERTAYRAISKMKK